jgi:hypothetical protein
MATHEIDLVEENARLHGKVKALEYEVEMLTMLVKNIIFSGQVFNPAEHMQQQVSGCDLRSILNHVFIVNDVTKK